MHDVEQLHDGGAVIRDGRGAPRVDHQLVHSPGSEGGAHGVRYGLQGYMDTDVDWAHMVVC